jgi:preprotein translocase subunit SecA
VALPLLIRNRDNLVGDGKVQLIDESTDRIMLDRQWSEGLHHLVMIKAGLLRGALHTTYGRIPLQGFFPRYCHPCEITDTVRPAARELWETYGLVVCRILPRHPDPRRWPPVAVFTTADETFCTLDDCLCGLAGQDIRVLVGARTVGAARVCSAVLAKRGIDYYVLNVEKVAREAMIVALAGKPGHLTVATNIAGKVSDVVLSDRARAAGECA